jgi:hypothetical protein
MEVGRVAERLGRGLQNLLQRFESARDLNLKKIPLKRDFFIFTKQRERSSHSQEEIKRPPGRKYSAKHYIILHPPW